MQRKDENHDFHCRKWWLDLIGKGDDFEVVMAFDLDCFDEAWVNICHLQDF